MADFTRRNPTDDTELIGTVLANPPRPRAVIALVHGFGEHAGRYRGFAPELEAQGLAVIALDLHGHGRTSGARGRCDRYERLREDVDMLVVEARERFPARPVFLYGHSMGGGLALDWALDRGGFIRDTAKLSGVIVSAPLIRPVDAPPRITFPVLRLVRRLHPGFSIPNPISGEQISTIPAEREAYEADPLNHHRLGVGLGLDMIAHGEALLKGAERFPLPLLLMHARGDELTDFAASERFAERAPDCNFVALEGVAHEIHNDTSRARVAALVGEFVDAHTEKQS